MQIKELVILELSVSQSQSILTGMMKEIRDFLKIVNETFTIADLNNTMFLCDFSDNK